MTLKSTARKPWLAALMSMILPGYGQMYNGEINKAIYLFLGFAFLCVGYALVALYLPDVFLVPMLALGLLASLAVWLYGMTDAWRVATRSSRHVSAAGLRSGPGDQIKSWQTGGMYLLTLVVCSTLVLPLLIGYVRAHLVEPFRIPSVSMQPSVLAGDYITADKRYNCPNCKHRIHRGDIAIFTYPNDRTANYIKRIIGMPGDRVQIRGHEVLINGQTLTRAVQPREGGIEVIEADGARQWTVWWASEPVSAQGPLSSVASSLPAPAVAVLGERELIVPPGQVMVLGDHRNGTQDSRSFGTVPMQDVIGRAHQVWFSKGAEGVRWERLGRVLK